MKTCIDSVLTFPNDIYQGLSIYIDLQEVSSNPPELLNGSTIFETILPKIFRKNDAPVFLAGNEQTESIFSAFFNQPEELKLPYQKIKTLELLLYLSKTELTSTQRLSGYKTEQICVVREIHDPHSGYPDIRLSRSALSGKSTTSSPGIWSNGSR